MRFGDGGARLGQDREPWTASGSPAVSRPNRKALLHGRPSLCASPRSKGERGCGTLETVRHVGVEDRCAKREGAEMDHRRAGKTRATGSGSSAAVALCVGAERHRSSDVVLNLWNLSRIGPDKVPANLAAFDWGVAAVTG